MKETAKIARRDCRIISIKFRVLSFYYEDSSSLIAIIRKSLHLYKSKINALNRNKTYSTLNDSKILVISITSFAD
jgi:hypothetical protein